MSNIAVILSGGVGSRIGGDLPKQYIKVNGIPVIQYCLETFIQHDLIQKIVICCADQWKSFVEDMLASMNVTKEILFSPAGDTRQLTVFNALVKLNGVCDDEDIILIHDAARPLVSVDLINRCIESSVCMDGALPVVGVKDTIYLSEDGKIISNLLNRSCLFAGQSPETLRYGKYYKICSELSRSEIINITGSTEIAYNKGMSISLVQGEDLNFKITTYEDLLNFENIVKTR